MSNDDFRRRLNDAFDDVSGSPSSSLSDKVRSAVANPPRAGEPYWVAGVAAAVIAVLIVGVLYVGGPLRPRPSQVGAVSTPTPSSTASPSPSPSPSPESFVCSSTTMKSTPPAAPVIFVSGLRTGTHAGYDRLTIDFSNGQVGVVELKTQSGTGFTLSPSGMPVRLKGTNSILVTVRGADLHTQYSGPVDIVTGYGTLTEVRRVQDFEGVVQLGLGINGPACYHAFWLTNPSRLVIDVQASS